jgi:hypothetical protein
MRALEHARALLGLAGRGLKALQGMHAADVDLLIVVHDPFGSEIVAFRKSIGYTGRCRLFVFPTTSCSIRAKKLPNGAAACGRGSCSIPDPDHARLRLRLARRDLRALWGMSEADSFADGIPFKEGQVLAGPK